MFLQWGVGGGGSIIFSAFSGGHAATMCLGAGSKFSYPNSDLISNFQTI